MEIDEQGLVETAESALLKTEPPSDVCETKDPLSGDASSEPRHFSFIKFKNYIEDLVRKLHKTYPLDYDKIKINLLVDDISLSVEHAIPCGLIINELLTNALKYAFPESFQGMGEITISMQKTEDGEIELFVQDNGVGFPEDFDLESAETCGMEIVKVLAADQLEGRYELQRNGITKFYICFSQPAEWID